MENIEKFDSNTLIQGVRDKIRATFVSLIPDAEWDKMVKKEVDNFFTLRDTYQSKRITSDFSQIVREVLEKEVRKKVEEFLTKEYPITWDENGRQVASEALKKLIVENSGQIVTQVLGNMLQTVLTQMSSLGPQRY